MVPNHSLWLGRVVSGTVRTSSAIASAAMPVRVSIAAS